jgi:hypothetical protein
MRLNQLDKIYSQLGPRRQQIVHHACTDRFLIHSVIGKGYYVSGT